MSILTEFVVLYQTCGIGYMRFFLCGAISKFSFLANMRLKNENRMNNSKQKNTAFLVNECLLN